jgi:long-subunit fatty acid transport protein
VVQYRDESLTTYELGLGYALTSSTQLVAGYRSQLFKNFNVTDNKNESGSIGGPIIGLNVNF